MGKFVGLSQAGINFVRGDLELVKVEEFRNVYPDGSVELVASRKIMKSSVRVESNDSNDDEAENGLHLREFIFPDGRVFREKVLISKKGFYFTALTDINGVWVEETVWSKKEIERILRDS